MENNHNFNAKQNAPLSILIVGAGIGGLTSALALSKEGHSVQVFEKSTLANEVGAAIHLAPNANGLLRRFGIHAESFGANVTNGLVEYDQSCQLQKDVDLRGPNSLWQHPWMLAHRVSLHDALKAAVTGDKGLKVAVRTASRVTSIDPASGTLVLEDGSTYSADLIIGADGLGSAARKELFPKIRAFGSGKSAFRFLIPKCKILENPLCEKYVQREGILTFWIANDRRIVMYPCSNNTVMNFVAIHPTELSNVRGEDWNRRGSQETLLSIFSSFDPSVLAILQLAEVETLKVWELLDMEQLPYWQKDKLVLLGDAAHPFLPHQGQGAAMAMEDAASLAALLPLGTTLGDISERLKLYQGCRYERASKIQAVTRIAGRDLDDSTKAEFDIREFSNYNFGHDEWHHSKHVLQKHLRAKNPSTYLRQPIAFGPMTSPRQDNYGNKVPSQHSLFTRYSIKIKTSRTYLQTLLPNYSFSFVSPGTIAEASFKVTTVDNLDWLGGGGYSFWGLWIHGLRYTKKDGSTLFGSYLPVLFENLTDPIITGREELGMPKLYSDIEITKDFSSVKINCGWRGSAFATFSFDDLVMTTQEHTQVNGHANTASLPPWLQKPRDDGLFIYRYVPAVGQPGKSDAEYPVFVPKNKPSCTEIVEKSWYAQNTTVKIDGMDWNRLPTLHHIATGLAEVPIYEILESTISRGKGVEDLSQAMRIE